MENNLKLRNESIYNYRSVDLKTLLSRFSLGLLFITIIQSYVLIISRKYLEDIEQSLLQTGKTIYSQAINKKNYKNKKKTFYVFQFSLYD